MDSHDARQVTFEEPRFQINERFLYEYDFGDLWQHEIRIERHDRIETGRTYPVWVGEKSGVDHRRTAEEPLHFWSDGLRRPFTCKNSWTSWQRTSRPAIGTPLRMGSPNCSRGGSGSDWMTLIDEP